ncbi:MAG: IS200/IS605 family transposase [Syntrophorhabdales bacterium]|jgi:putative transposase
MPDHVHLSIMAPPRHSPARLAGKIKGGVGSTLAAKFPELKKRGHIWRRSYFCATTGAVSSDVIRHYVEMQWDRIR